MAPEKAEAPTRKVWPVALALIVGITIGIGLLNAFMAVGVGGFPLPTVAIFFVATLIGMVGAFVYIVVQMVADKELSVLQNLLGSKLLPQRLGLPLFILSGGVVAGMTQASVGSFGASNIWSIFLIGFGWLGVISGVGGSTAVGVQAEEVVKRGLAVESLDKLLEDSRKAAEREMERKVESIEAFYEAQLQKVRGSLGG